MTAAALLLRSQLGAALVVRGDELLVRNAYGDASVRYERALLFDPESEAAVDRLTFVALQRRSTRALLEGVSVASRYLRNHEKSHTVLFDRGLCFLLLREYARAFVDFRAAAAVTQNPQQYVFAGWAAKRSGRLREAIALWRAALSVRHRYRPAILALRELRL